VWSINQSSQRDARGYASKGGSPGSSHHQGNPAASTLVLQVCIVFDCIHKLPTRPQPAANQTCCKLIVQQCTALSKFHPSLKHSSTSYGLQASLGHQSSSSVLSKLKAYPDQLQQLRPGTLDSWMSMRYQRPEEQSEEQVTEKVTEDEQRAHLRAVGRNGPDLLVTLRDFHVRFEPGVSSLVRVCSGTAHHAKG